jgi:hypothetical protein
MYFTGTVHQQQAAAAPLITTPSPSHMDTSLPRTPTAGAATAPTLPMSSSSTVHGGAANVQTVRYRGKSMKRLTEHDTEAQAKRLRLTEISSNGILGGTMHIYAVLHTYVHDAILI